MSLESLKEKYQFEPNLYDERVMLIMLWAMSSINDKRVMLIMPWAMSSIDEV